MGKSPLFVVDKVQNPPSWMVDKVLPLTNLATKKRTQFQTRFSARTKCTLKSQKSLEPASSCKTWTSGSDKPKCVALWFQGHKVVPAADLMKQSRKKSPVESTSCSPKSSIGALSSKSKSGVRKGMWTTQQSLHRGPVKVPRFPSPSKPPKVPLYNVSKFHPR